MIITTQQTIINRENEARAERNNTALILDDLDAINRGEKGWLDLGKGALRSELLERATTNDGVVSPRERELIDKAVDGKLTPGERDELTNLLPAYGNKGVAQADKARGKSTQELLNEVRDFDLTTRGIETSDKFALEELERRASQDGKMSAELNGLFYKIWAGQELTPTEFERFSQLLHEEDNLV